MSFSRRLARPAYAAFLIAAASVISGCSLMMDFDTPIPEGDTGVGDSGVETSVDSTTDSFVDSGMDTEADSGTDGGADTTDSAETSADADETSADADETSADADETSADADETSVDADETSVDADETSVDAADATDADDAAETDTAPMCTSASECPGTDTECMTKTCASGVCGFSFADDGAPVSAQTTGDCKKVVCDGAGGTKSIDFDSDLPNDGNGCTTDSCSSGVPLHSNSGAGTSCSESGGKVCDGAGACVECVANPDCTSGVCNTTSHTCAAASCSDTTKNGDESDIDCGGSCPTKCALSKGCAATTDCVTGLKCDGTKCVECTVGTDCPSSGLCDTTTGTCKAAACDDTYKNGSETDVDCGGSCTTKCAFGQGCAATTDCATGLKCDGTKCVNCTVDSECPSKLCDVSAGTCKAAACNDSVTNGSETDVDCGGTVCLNRCGDGKTCAIAADCTSGVCTGFTCAAATCSDNAQNGDETDKDCGGSCTKHCEVGEKCATGADCESGVCTSSVCAAPSVLSTTPADGASGVSTSATITVTFAGPMDGTTLTTQSTSGTCTGNVQVSTDNFATCVGLSGFVLGSGNTVATWTPSPALSYGSTYKIRVTTGSTDGFGNGLGAQYTSATGFTTTAPTCASDVVISQIYGGGGNVYDRDYVVLHNRGSASVDITGWSLQYTTAVGGTAWGSNKVDLSGAIAGGGYYLVGLAATTGATSTLPTPDASGSIDIGESDGKLALVSSTTALAAETCPTSTAIVDLVGYGTADCKEGTAAAPAASATTALFRKSDGCTDSGNNSTDFATGTPTPRSIATPAATCCETRNESAISAEADYCAIQSDGSVWDITVAAGAATRTIYGQVYELGLTEAAGEPSGVVAQVGYGPTTVNPSTQSGWTWSAATWNTQVGNNDEYGLALTAPSTAGTYRYAYRFSLDSGATWTYCDTNGAGSNSGLTFEVTQLPTLTVTP